MKHNQSDSRVDHEIQKDNGGGFSTGYVLINGPQVRFLLIAVTNAQR